MVLTVCPKCNIKYYCVKIGVWVIEIVDNDIPYKIYRSDIYKCRVCKNNILSGFGEPILHHDNDFNSLLNKIIENGDYFTFN